jgi:tetratricopeptide (TPR) repeat protein
VLSIGSARKFQHVNLSDLYVSNTQILRSLHTLRMTLCKGYGANLWDATLAKGGGKPRIQMAQSRVEQLKEILAQDADNFLTRYALAMEYSNCGDVNAAVAEFKLLLEKNPDYANAYFMAAQALAGAERGAEAVQMLRDGIAAAKRSGNGHAESEMQLMLDDLERL